MHHAARLTLAAVTLAAVTLAACGGSPGTATPPASSSAPTASALVATAPAISAAPPASAAPIATAVDPTPVDGMTQGPAVEITAQIIQFEPQAVTVPANVPLTLVFTNADAGVPHGLQLSDANGNGIAKGEIIEGPARTQVALPALVPGTYRFICPVHPNMTGTITAQP